MGDSSNITKNPELYEHYISNLQYAYKISTRSSSDKVYIFPSWPQQQTPIFKLSECLLNPRITVVKYIHLISKYVSKPFIVFSSDKLHFLLTTPHFYAFILGTILIKLSLLLFKNLKC